MTTNGANAEDAEIGECDGEKVVTMMDVLQEQQEFEDDANAVLGASDDKNCTYSKGYIKRQAVYACMTCCSEAKDDPEKRAGICLACSLTCHENHELLELYTKRNFCCDCGNCKFNHPCQYTQNKTTINDNNIYNQNFSGLYCTCHRPYPDPDGVEEEMIQCIVCEDWLHASHLETTVPSNELYAEMICKACMEKNEFLHDYNIYAVNGDVDVVDTNKSADLVIHCNKKINQTNGIDDKTTCDKTESEDIKITDTEVKIETNTIEAINTSHDGIPVNNDEEQIEIKDTVSQKTEDDHLAEEKQGNVIVSEKANHENSTEEDQAKDTEEKENETSDEISQPCDNISAAINSMEQEYLKDEPTTSSESIINDIHDGAEDAIDANIEQSNQEIPPKDCKENNQDDDQQADVEIDKTNETFMVNINSQEQQEDTPGLTLGSGADTIDEMNKPDIDFVDNSQVKQEDTTVLTPGSGGDTIVEMDKPKIESMDNIQEKQGDATDSTLRSAADSVVKMDTQLPITDNLTSLECDQINENKRKLPTEGTTLEVSTKKPKLSDSKCFRPVGEKKLFKGATFWPSHFRQKLCTCNHCITMYKDLSVLFLIDPEDTVTAYEDLGKEKTNGTASTQYEKGLEALSSLGRIQQINALTEYNKMRDKLLDFLKSFKDRKEVVKEEDIKAFFAGMKPKREPDGVYFCR